MAGFFGLFDYSKAGPGVSKNGPQKKGFAKFFELYFRKFWKLSVANLIYSAISLPLVTGGLANAGITFVTRNFVREKHAFVYGDFTDTIKKNWKQALPVGIINLFLTLLIIVDVIFLDPFGIFSVIYATFSNEPAVIPDHNMMHSVMIAMLFCVWLIFSFVKYYIYIMLVTFKLSIKQLYKNGLIFAFVGLWRNLLIFLVMGFIYTAAVLLIMSFPQIGIIVAIAGYLFMFHGFKAFLIQFATFPLIKKHIIDPYYKDHPNEDKNAKRALNLDDSDEEIEGDGERIFEDVDEIESEEEIEKPKSKIPRQYTRQEMDRLRRKQSKTQDDDDDTI